MLVIKNLSLTMSKDLRLLLEDFNFSLQEGMKVAVIGEEGNGKSTLFRAIVEPETLQGYLEIEGEIIKAGEIIGYLPQILPDSILEQSTLDYFNTTIDWEHFDYAHYYDLLRDVGFPENQINESIRVRDLSGGEKIKFQLLCIMMKQPTVLLLDEPSNDLDLESVRWLEHFILQTKVPLMFISHDEVLLERCANTIIHLEQLMRKHKPKYTIARLGYGDYVENRDELILKQTQLAQKEKEEYQAKMERYRQIYQRVHHEQQKVSRQDPGTAKNLKDKMHTVKSMGKRFEREKEQLTKRPDVEDSINVRFEHSIRLPRSKVILELDLKTLEVEGLILSRNVQLRVLGTDKICIVGPNGSGKTTLLRHMLNELEELNLPYGYMPQDYSERMDPRKNAIEFLTKSGTAEEHTTIRTYLGSMNFTSEEMFHPTKELSGGQRAKLYFSKMILDQAQVLILDEPTRNLSPLSGPEIRAALKGFGGSIIAVSHDRRFISEVFDQVFRLGKDGLYLEKMAKE